MFVYRTFAVLCNNSFPSIEVYRTFAVLCNNSFREVYRTFAVLFIELLLCCAIIVSLVYMFVYRTFAVLCNNSFPSIEVLSHFCCAVQ